MKNLVKFVHLPRLNVEISLRPVTYEEYWQGPRNISADHKSKELISRPVTEVSATEARKYAKHMGGRLPTFDEISALANHVKNFRSAFACSSEDCLCEWLDCAPDWARENGPANCIVNPSWLQQKKGEAVRGSIPDRPMSFVTFRIVRN